MVKTYMMKNLINVFIKAVKSQKNFRAEVKKDLYSYLPLRNKKSVYYVNSSFLIRLYRGSRFSIPSKKKLHFFYKLIYNDDVTIFSPIENHLFKRADLEYLANIENLFIKYSILNVLDLGANIGSFSIPLSIKYKKCQFVCVDVNYDNLLSINKTKSKLKLDNLVTMHNACWSNANELIEIVHTNSVSSSVIKSGISNFKTNSFPKYKVKTIDFTTLIDTYNNFDLLKIDIEGSEYEFFKNNFEKLGEIKFLICELHNLGTVNPSNTELFKQINKFFNIIEIKHLDDSKRIELIGINKMIINESYF